MCIVLFAYKKHPRYPLVLAGNRDEFYNRPTAPAAFWQDEPKILGGRDLRCGGTWLGVTKEGKIAVLANHREGLPEQINARSRGLLVRDVLLDDRGASETLEELKRSADLYGGFSLIFGSARKLYYFSNRSSFNGEISPGIHGQSNHLLDTPWPKVERGKEGLRRVLSTEVEPLPERLFALLADDTAADDSRLPDTGVGMERERILSPIFVRGQMYGTRSSTVVFIDRDDTLTFLERTYDGNPQRFTTREFRFATG